MAPPSTDSGRAPLTLVLGAGGIVGMAYHAGVLRALHRVAGWDPVEARLIIGTSAGSVVGARLRTGWTTDDLWEEALDPAAYARGGGGAEVVRPLKVFTPAWASVPELARRGLGSAYVMARSTLRLPGPGVPASLRRRFPGGLFTLAEAERRLAGELPETWPEREMWICAFDLDSGRRVVFGRQGAPDVPLLRAILASCAIPGVYPPVRQSGMTLVDGGAYSTTSLDLAAGHPLVVGVAPMAFEPAQAPGRFRQLLRRVPSRQLSAEMRLARARGSEVLLLRPSAAELDVHGGNPMRFEPTAAVARAAYEAAARLIDTDRFRSALGND